MGMGGGRLFGGSFRSCVSRRRSRAVLAGKRGPDL